MLDNVKTNDITSAPIVLTRANRTLTMTSAMPILVAAMSAGVELVLWGDPGIGKSAIMAALAEAVKRQFWGMAMSLYGPETMLGLATFGEDDDGNRTTEFAAPGWAKRANAAPKATVLFDEFNTAGPMLQRGSLRVLSEHEVGELRLKDSVQFFLAGNHYEMDGHPMIPSTANRVGHLSLGVDREDAQSWATYQLSRVGEAEYDLLAGVRIVSDPEFHRLWDDEHRKTVKLVTSFIMEQIEDADANKLGAAKTLQNMPGKRDKQRHYAWPSKRTWEKAMRAYTSAKIHELGPFHEAHFCGAFVGLGLWEAFMDWREERLSGELPDPAEFLDRGCDGWADDERMDRTDAMIAACVAIVQAKSCPRRSKRVVALWNWLADLCDTCAPSVAVPSGQLNKAGLNTGPKGVTAAAERFQDRYAEVAFDQLG